MDLFKVFSHSLKKNKRIKHSERLRILKFFSLAGINKKKSAVISPFFILIFSCFYTSSGFSNSKINSADKDSLSDKMDPLNTVKEERPVFDFADGLISKRSQSSQTFGNKLKTKLDAILQREIVGQVVDSKTNEPLAGVTVRLKGTTVGVTTDENGRFSLQVEDDAVLQVSFVGYRSQEISVGERNSIDISLTSATTGLEQLVVVGYGRMKNEDISGSQQSISPETFERQPVRDINTALTGKAAGVRINQANGRPGSGFSVRIRGANSINGSNDPLTVVDGIQGGIVGDPNNIESIEILKGAAATAIYGSRGANGVILITTKSGSSDQLNINFKSYIGFQTVPKEHRLNLLNGADFARTVNAERAAVGANPAFSNQKIEELEKSGGTDWQSVSFEDGAPVQHYQISFNEKRKNGLSYYIAGDYVKNNGYVYHLTHKKYGFLSRIDFKYSDKLNFGLKVNGDRTEDNGSVVNVTSAVRMDPTMPPYKDEKGDFTFQSAFANVSPNPYLQARERIGRNVSTNTDVAGTIVYDFSDALSLHLLGSVRQGNNNNNTYSPILFDGKGRAVLYNRHTIDLQNTNRLTFDKEFDSNNSLRADLIFEQQYAEYQDHQVEASDFPSDATTYFDPSLAATTTATENYFNSKLISYIGRVHYVWRNKYIATAAGRVDGSSKFRKGHRYGFFPSGSLGWKMEQEDFMKNSNLFNQFKWRLSYGATGSEGIAALATRGRLITGNDVNYSMEKNGTRQTGIAPPSALANPFLTWETTYQTDFGVDIAILNSKVTFTADIYRKRTKDLLMDVPLPIYTGADHTTRNLGEIENKGLELSIGSKPVDNDEVKLDVNFNISFNRNKVLSLGDQSEILTGGSTGPLGGTYPLLIKPGYSLGTFRGYVFDGIYQESQKDEAAKFSKQPGDARYKDLNGDGTITSDDITTIGSSEPNFYYGFNGTLTYKNFDLNIVVTGRNGGDVFNLVYGQLFGIAGETLDPVTRDILNRWTPDNPSNFIPGFSTTTQTYLVSSQFVQDGSYLRINNLSLNYNFPSKILNGTFVKAVRLYASVQNLLTLTKKEFVGYDPELHAETNTDAYQGLYFNFESYPIARTITLGLNINF